MGCLLSSEEDRIPQLYKSFPALNRFRADFEALALKEDDIGRLYHLFLRIDSDRSGNLDIEEMFRFLELETSKFTKRIFSIFDEDNSGEIDFREFVISLWSYCTLGKPALIMFAFDLYDNDGSGEIDLREVEGMLKEIYGKQFDTNPHARSIFFKIQKLGGGRLGSEITIDQFREFVRNHPGLLYPAFMFQTDLQSKVLGVDFWDHCAQYRIEISQGKYININQLLSTHINEEAFRTLIEEGIKEEEKLKREKEQEKIDAANGKKRKKKKKKKGKKKKDERKKGVNQKMIDALVNTGSLAQRRYRSMGSRELEEAKGDGEGERKRNSIDEEDFEHGNKRKKKRIKTKIGGIGVKEARDISVSNPVERRKAILEDKASNKIKRSQVHPSSHHHHESPQHEEKKEEEGKGHRKI